MSLSHFREDRWWRQASKQQLRQTPTKVAGVFFSDPPVRNQQRTVFAEPVLILAMTTRLSE